MRNYLSFILIPFIISSCVFSNCKVKDLPKSEKAWFKPYKIGQMFIYRSNLNRIDTLKVIRVMDDYSPCNKFELGDYQFNIQDVGFQSAIFGQYIYANFNITESNQVERGFKFIDLFGFYTDNEINEYSGMIKINSFPDSIIAYTFNESNARSDYNGFISSFSWSKEYGIVRYETKEGERFELIQ